MKKPYTPRDRPHHHLGMNGLERDYAQHLETLRLTRKIRGWHWQSIKFRLADKTWYHPDFMVIAEDGELEIHETKGFMREDANVKLKVTSALYWEYTVKLIQRAGRDGFAIREIMA